MPINLPRGPGIKTFLHIAKSSLVPTWARHIALLYLYTTIPITHTSTELFPSSTVKPLALPSINFQPTDFAAITRCRNIAIPSSGLRLFTSFPCASHSNCIAHLHLMKRVDFSSLEVLAGYIRRLTSCGAVHGHGHRRSYMHMWYGWWWSIPRSRRWRWYYQINIHPWDTKNEGKIYATKSPCDKLEEEWEAEVRGASKTI
ncbi:hypothetical protein BD779DRAFT_174075 [Infundibulicybe gibba]|nr:hypothetical protein BD779DRAFT_174075 [Infundibulicybe gibba]